MFSLLSKCHKGLWTLILLFVVSASAIANVANQSDSEKVILLGFDGGSFHLAEKFMNEGKLPNCQRLRDQGTFDPLGSANPAESPVAWASLNTGMNPGSTNIFGFMRRLLPGGNPIPTIGYSRKSEVALVADPDYAVGAAENGESGGGAAAGDSPAASRSNNMLWIGIAVGVVVLGILMFGMKAKSGAAALMALAIGSAVATGAWQNSNFTMPMDENDLRVKNFWDYLDEAGKTSRVMQAGVRVPSQRGSQYQVIDGLVDARCRWQSWNLLHLFQ